VINVHQILYYYGEHSRAVPCRSMPADEWALIVVIHHTPYNHANIPPLSYLQAGPGCPSCRPTNGVKALKAIQRFNSIDLYRMQPPGTYLCM